MMLRQGWWHCLATGARGFHAGRFARPGGPAGLLRQTVLGITGKKGAYDVGRSGKSLLFRPGYGRAFRRDARGRGGAWSGGQTLVRTSIVSR